MKIKPIKTTYDKFLEFAKTHAKRGSNRDNPNAYHYMDRYGWGLSPDDKEALMHLKKDHDDLIVLEIPEKEIDKFAPTYPYVFISDKNKFFTTVAKPHLDEFIKFYCPGVELEI